MAYLSGYAYRASVPVTYTSAGAQTNYQMKLAIIKGAGSNSAGTVYLNDHALNWPYDVRFTKSDGTSLLDFYRSEYDTTDGTWYIELDSIASSGNTEFFIYYGKTSDSDASSGDNTFLFFDDFEANNFNKWNTSGGSWSVTSAQKAEGSYSALTNGVTGNRTLGKNITLNSCKWLYKTYASTPGNTFYGPYPSTNRPSNIIAISMIDGYFKYWPGGGWVHLPTATTYNETTWYSVEVAFDFEQSKIRWKINGADKGNLTLKDSGGTTLTSSNSLATVAFFSCNTDQLLGYIDQVMIAKFIYPEPTWATPGNEESISTGSIAPILMTNKRRWSS